MSVITFSVLYLCIKLFVGDWCHVTMHKTVRNVSNVLGGDKENLPFTKGGVVQVEISYIPPTLTPLLKHQIDSTTAGMPRNE